ncbi:DUF2000 domain-containing protein [Rathayibacter caricis DSM 15933]|uniref:DUF2000 domain-containing protein n=1 Tax=Rathayibacter caricis DSM 15933 TaxID=1328867 RepID=A0A2T4URL3_9MICO|nr:DUF2000 domain-containing protein [Rathayibacter caricis]PTL72172.1 DUF2000 domain-containing protein [Rathayibacter caricis DSM 15933]
MPLGFAPDEIDTAASTRSARLKWVIVVDAALPAGRAVNAAVCAAAATSAGVTGLLGPAAVDADGSVHVGLPWAGCSILVADRAALAVIRSKAEAHDEVFVADVPVAAQETRVYDEFLAAVAEAGADAMEYLAVSLVGPRNRVDRIVGRLALMP